MKTEDKTPSKKAEKWNSGQNTSTATQILMKKAFLMRNSLPVLPMTGKTIDIGGPVGIETHHSGGR